MKTWRITKANSSRSILGHSSRRQVLTSKPQRTLDTYRASKKHQPVHGLHTLKDPIKIPRFLDLNISYGQLRSKRVLFQVLKILVCATALTSVILYGLEALNVALYGLAALILVPPLLVFTYKFFIEGVFSVRYLEENLPHLTWGAGLLEKYHRVKITSYQRTQPKFTLHELIFNEITPTEDHLIHKRYVPAIWSNTPRRAMAHLFRSTGFVIGIYVAIRILSRYNLFPFSPRGLIMDEILQPLGDILTGGLAYMVTWFGIWLFDRGSIKNKYYKSKSISEISQYKYVSRLVDLIKSKRPDEKNRKIRRLLMQIDKRRLIKHPVITLRGTTGRTNGFFARNLITSLFVMIGTPFILEGSILLALSYYGVFFVALMLGTYLYDYNYSIKFSRKFEHLLRLRLGIDPDFKIEPEESDD